MSLSKFILENLDRVLDEWDKYAASMRVAQGLDQAELRDHAEHMLVAIAKDMQEQQSAYEQESKSKGGIAKDKDSPDTAAESHAGHRFEKGFDLPEMISEYRALRASVIRLWTATDVAAKSESVAELTRFNEGIDQAMMESAIRFSNQITRSRELLIGVLGHDLRTPLHIILNSAGKLLKESQTPEDQVRFATYIHDAGQTICSLVNDLLDVSRTRLGGQLPLEPESIDSVEVCTHVISQFRVLHPNRHFVVESVGEPRGTWDRLRLEQLLANLVRNAIQHGSADSAIKVIIDDKDDRVYFSVHNFGEPIPRDLLRHIFEPLRTGSTTSKGSMGLGLYIACQIAQAHGGTLKIDSSREQGTRFTACLPKETRPDLVRSRHSGTDD